MRVCAHSYKDRSMHSTTCCPQTHISLLSGTRKHEQLQTDGGARRPDSVLLTSASAFSLCSPFSSPPLQLRLWDKGTHTHRTFSPLRENAGTVTNTQSTAFTQRWRPDSWGESEPCQQLYAKCTRRPDSHRYKFISQSYPSNISLFREKKKKETPPHTTSIKSCFETAFTEVNCKMILCTIHKFMLSVLKSLLRDLNSVNICIGNESYYFNHLDLCLLCILILTKLAIHSPSYWIIHQEELKGLRILFFFFFMEQKRRNNFFPNFFKGNQQQPQQINVSGSAALAVSHKWTIFFVFYVHL